MSRYLVCDVCGGKLHLPTTPALAEGWQRHSVGSGNTLEIRYTCPKCNPAKIKAIMEARNVRRS
ncbi:hypothetical protein HYP71_gp068 [Arthrobacter phage KBurrousTX]|uniref:Uncharacterized protein n=1 Tax=Arthrobacter phage KBurrousTX TaxID=2315608 RepID=A0A386K9V9_9CAUD|nr:hypothetical protein HYP71_gp068 [Arthrobacter phage KBurrousTX]AYD81562.1 hypothetical protein KBurrousTX_68 [Arthrobacter phage KBurrousTX]